MIVPDYGIVIDGIQKAYENALKKKKEQTPRDVWRWPFYAEKAYYYQQQIKKYQQLHRVAINHLKRLSNPTTTSFYNYTFEVSYRKGAVDYKRIPALQYVNLEEYRKPEVPVYKLTKDI